MYTLTTLQAPRGHMTRPRPYAIGHKVNSLLFEPSLSTCETWLLPHAWTLHTLRYNRDDHGGSKDRGQAWKRRRKKKQGQASEKPGTSGPRTFRPARNLHPSESRPALSAPTLWIARNLAGTCPEPLDPGTSGPARNFRPVCAQCIGPSPCTPSLSLTPSWASTIYTPPPPPS